VSPHLLAHAKLVERGFGPLVGEVLRKYHVTLEELLSDSKGKTAIRARCELMYRIRYSVDPLGQYAISYGSIAYWLGMHPGTVRKLVLSHERRHGGVIDAKGKTRKALNAKTIAERRKLQDELWSHRVRTSHKGKPGRGKEA
jgi:hypothetical protein